MRRPQNPSSDEVKMAAWVLIRRGHKKGKGRREKGKRKRAEKKKEVQRARTIKKIGAICVIGRAYRFPKSSEIGADFRMKQILGL